MVRWRSSCYSGIFLGRKFRDSRFMNKTQSKYSSTVMSVMIIQKKTILLISQTLTDLCACAQVFVILRIFARRTNQLSRMTEVYDCLLLALGGILKSACYL